MTMTALDARQAVRQIEPTTKAAKLREVMPEIEMKLAAGVQLGAVHEALIASGFDLTFQTLKTYLYRHRKQRGKSVDRRASPAAPRSANESVSYETDLEVRAPREPISMQELNRVMKPDPAKQAEDLALYERIGKQRWRERKQ